MCTKRARDESHIGRPPFAVLCLKILRALDGALLFLRRSGFGVLGVGSGGGTGRTVFPDAGAQSARASLCLLLRRYGVVFFPRYVTVYSFDMTPTYAIAGYARFSGLDGTRRHRRKRLVVSARRRVN